MVPWEDGFVYEDVQNANTFSRAPGSSARDAPRMHTQAGKLDFIAGRLHEGVDASDSTDTKKRAGEVGEVSPGEYVLGLTDARRATRVPWSGATGSCESDVPTAYGSSRRVEYPRIRNVLTESILARREI